MDNVTLVFYNYNCLLEKLVKVTLPFFGKETHCQTISILNQILFALIKMIKLLLLGCITLKEYC